MGAYQLSFQEERNLLVIHLEGAFTLEEVHAYRQNLIEFVNGLKIRQVLIDQANAEFPPNAMDIFAKNAEIPELRETATAVVYAPFLYDIMKKMPPELSAGSPEPFTDFDDADAWLKTVSM